ncbi:MAG: efflux RND transporter periplasmic adaptor subunit [Desulforegulaceae bacterium]|nr:efflux RND transporter periplasmic adaptor subunit [Desulforegulaceae bacterium]
MQPKNKYNKYLNLAAFMLALFAITAISGCSNAQSQQGQEQRPDPSVSYMMIKSKAVDLTTELPGRTSAYLVSEIRPQVNGIIEKRFFEEGADIKEGDILYKIDDAPFKASLKAAQASLDKAKAGLPPVQSREARYKRLLKGKAISQQEYDDVKSQLDQILAEINFLEAQVDTAKINLGYTNVKAPISGKIGKSNVTVGALVTAYQQIPLTTIHKLDPIYVDAAQSTAEMLELRENIKTKTIEKNAHENKVKIILENGSIYPLDGNFKFRDVTVDPSTGSSTLRIVVPNPSKILLPGMYVRAVVQEGTAQNAILAPQQGVVRTPKGEPVAYIVNKEGKIEQRFLTINRAIGNKWLITSGLENGDKIIVEGLLNIRPGMSVNASEFQTAEKE